MKKVKEFIVKNKIFMIVAVILIIAIAVIVGIKLHKDNVVKKEKAAIKETVEKYMTAFNELNSENMLNTIDAKAAYAWSQCSGTTAEKEKQFKEEYDKTKDTDAESYINNMKNEIAMLSSIYEKYLDNYKVELADMEDFEEVEGVEGLVKVKAKTKTSFTYEGNENKSESDAVFYLYNGKIITMEDASNTSTETTTDENKTETTDEKKDETTEKKDDKKEEKK